MDTIIDITPETKAVVEKSENLALQLQTFKVSNQDEYNTSGEYLKNVKSATKQLEDMRMSMTRPLDESKKRIMDFFRKPLDILTNAEEALKRARIAYSNEQEKKRREEEARLAEMARKEAEKLAARANAAEAKGNTEKAEMLRQKAQETEMITPAVAPKVEKVAGISIMTTWKFRIVNPKLIPVEYMLPDEKTIGKMVRAGGGKWTIPGIEIYPEQTESVRA